MDVMSARRLGRTASAIVLVTLLSTVGGVHVAAQVAAQPRRPPRPSTGPQSLTLPVILAIEDARAPTESDLAILLEAARTDSGQPPAQGGVQIAAIRALGRLERRDVISDLLPLLQSEATRGEAANALAQALRGARLESVPAGQQEQLVFDALLAAGTVELSAKAPYGLSAVARSIGRLPFSSPTQVKTAEAFLRRVLETSFPFGAEPHVGAARALESLARLNRKAATLDDETVSRLRTIARSADPKRAEHKRNAMAALVAAQGLDGETLRIAFEDPDIEVRRLATLAAGGTGSIARDEDRTAFVRDALRDSAFMVRIEAVRAWARRQARVHGCQPLLEALDDRNLHVALAAIDVIADQCPDDANVTNRLVAEARAPGTIGPWQREAHAIVALARRSPDRAELRLSSFAAHTNWHVRMYGARAAGIIGQAQVLTDLADDPNDNVAEAALPPLRKLAGAESDSVFVAALNRKNKAVGRNDVRPYQAIRAAAIALEGATPTPALAGALADALERISLEQCETSRDTRVALITRLNELGSEQQASVLAPLLRDFDPIVARAASGVLTRWSGKQVVVDLPLPPLRAAPPLERILPPAAVLVEMENGKTFEIRFNGQAPLARARFLELAERGYYDDTDFHRIASNFVIQGGGPNSNEYCGACPFARDEVGLVMNTRGTIGISTRGRDTGDSQIFVNLVDSPRLDHEFTVFARVCQDGTKDGMETVDSVHEGDRIARMRVVTPGDNCR
jgi:cyclophilin family peptidyl-prolyl cis-trans isomerase